MFKRWRRGQIEKRDLSALSFIPSNLDGSGFTYNSIADGDTLGLPAVWACTSLITNAIASLPIDTYRRDAAGIQTSIANPEIIEQPSPEMSRQDWLTQAVAALLLKGNSYSLIVGRDLTGTPAVLLPIANSLVTVRRDGGGRIRYRFGAVEVDASEVLHIRGLTLTGELEGLSVIGTARAALSVAVAGQKHATNFFNDAGIPSVAITTPDMMDETEAESYLQRWSARQASSRRPALLVGGMTLEALTINPEDSQLLQSRQFSVAEVARLFGVPPHMIGDSSNSTSWGSGLSEQSAGFLRFTLRPWLTRIETALSSLLPADQYVKFNAEALLRSNTLERYQAYEVALRNSWMTVAEVREKEDLPALGASELTGLVIPNDARTLTGGAPAMTRPAVV